MENGKAARSSSFIYFLLVGQAWSILSKWILNIQLLIYAIRNIKRGMFIIMSFFILLAGLNHYYRKSLRWAFISIRSHQSDTGYETPSRSEYKKWQKDSGASDFIMKMGFDTRNVSIFGTLLSFILQRFETLRSIDRFPIWLKSREFVISHESDSYEVELNHMARNVLCCWNFYCSLQ